MSVKSMVKEHFANGPISEHFKNHGIFQEKNYLDLYNHDKNIEIRKFSIGDMDECVSLYKDVFSSEPWNDEWISTDQVKYYLMELIENPVFEGFVAYENSFLVAVCFGHKRSWWAGKEFFIDELFVANKMQGNGIGTRLLQYVECNLLMLDCMKLTLLTNKDIAAEDFYLKKGFIINQNKIIMTKNII